MFAVIKTGGKQYRVEPGSMLRVEKIAAAVGDTIAVDDILMTADGDHVTIGTPTVSGVRVMAEIVDQIRDRKIIVFKKRRRKSSRSRRGHRQALTVLRIREIVAGETA